MSPAALRAWRQAHGFSQEEAARLFGVQRRGYQRWESDGKDHRTMEGAAQRLAVLLHDDDVLAKALALLAEENGCAAP